MERRRLVKGFFAGLTIGGLLLLGGCKEEKKLLGFGNQEKLWQLTTAESKMEEPVDLAYAKGTAALYRDASMGKADPNFVPKLTGG
jgi:hypothetical protein